MPRHFDNWLSAYVEHTSLGETPTSFNFWTGVATVAGALRRRVWIDELSFRWWANFYIVLVGPAGLVTKSTSLAPSIRMLSKVDGVVFGPRSVTWQALVKALASAHQEDTFTLPDGKLDLRTDSPITIEVSEMGTFFKMEDHVMMDVLTDLWDSPSGNWRHVTLTGGDNQIENPWINIIACTTPTWIKTHFPDHMIGGGLASRMLFVYADAKRQLIAYPSQAFRPQDYHEREKLLIEDLQRIALIKGQYRLDSEAIEWGTNWYKTFWNSPRPQHLASERYSGYLSRKQAHVHKLALILAAAQRNETIITMNDLQTALALVEAIEPSMIRVFESIGRVAEAVRTDEIVAYLHTYDSLTSSELWNLVANIMTQKEFRDSLQAALDSDKLVRTTKNGINAVRLNPELRKKT